MVTVINITFIAKMSLCCSFFAKSIAFQLLSTCMYIHTYAQIIKNIDLGFNIISGFSLPESIVWGIF